MAKYASPRQIAYENTYLHLFSVINWFRLDNQSGPFHFPCN